MAREKLKKQDLRLKEDEFLTMTMSAQNWLAQNYQSLIGVIVIALAIMAAVSFFKSRRARTAADNNADYAIAQTYVYSVPYMHTPESAAQRDQLITEANTKISALMDRAGSKPLGRSALYLKASLHYQMHEYDAAITATTNFLNSASTNEERARGQLLLGYCYESKVNEELMKPSSVDLQQADAWRTQAMDAYVKGTAAAKGSYLEYEGLMCQARILDMQGKVDESLAMLERVKTERDWFAKHYEKATNFDSDLPVAMFLKSMEESGRYTTYAELASLYEKRLEGLAGSSN